MSAAEERPYDEAVETLRRAINSLPRYSFLLDDKGNVRRVIDGSGRWVEWQSIHEMFDSEAIDGLIGKRRALAAIAKAAEPPPSQGQLK